MATVPPTKSKLVIKRDGKTTTRLVPRPRVIVDTRELQYEFEDFTNWISGTERKALLTGDYSVAGYEDRIVLERKTLNDLVGSLMDGRARFLREMERLGKIEYRCLLIEASRTQVKSPYRFAEKAHPNGIAGSVDALSARYGLPVFYADNRVLGIEMAASWLSKCHAYAWLDDAGYGRCLQENDL